MVLPPHHLAHQPAMPSADKAPSWAAPSPHRHTTVMACRAERKGKTWRCRPCAVGLRLPTIATQDLDNKTSRPCSEQHNMGGRPFATTLRDSGHRPASAKRARNQTDQTPNQARSVHLIRQVVWWAPWAQGLHRADTTAFKAFGEAAKWLCGEPKAAKVAVRWPGPMHRASTPSANQALSSLDPSGR